MTSISLPPPPKSPTARWAFDAALRHAAQNRAAQDHDPTAADAQNLAHVTDAVSYILAHANAPAAGRGLIDALIGLSAGREGYFPGPDEFLAERMGRCAKTVQRQREILVRWLNETHTGLIGIEGPDYNDATGEKKPHRYRVWALIEAALETLSIARLSRDWSPTRPGPALKQAAAHVHAAVERGAGYRPRQRRTPDAMREMERCLRTATTLLNNVRKMVEGCAQSSDFGGTLARAAIRRDVLADLEDALAAVRAASDDPAAGSVDTMSVFLAASTSPVGARAGHTDVLDMSTSYLYEIDIDSPARDTGAARRPHCAARVPVSDVDAAAGAGESVCPSDGGHNVQHVRADETLVERREVNIGEASEALGAFADVGAAEFGLCVRDEGAQTATYSTLSLADADHPIFEAVARTGKENVSAIVRPCGPGLIQADDLDAAALERVRPFAFAAIETSAGNYQAWLRLSDADEATRLAVRRRLLRELRADIGATGALRLPGSISRKPGRGGWRVRLLWTAPHNLPTAAELEAAGLLAAVESPAPSPPMGERRADATGFPARWPSYDIEAARWPDDRSRADYAFALIAAKRGFAEDETVTELMSQSPKAQQAGRRYATRTVASAFRAAGGGAL